MKKFLSAFLVLLLAVCPVLSGAENQQPTNRLEKVLSEGKLVMGTAPGYPPYEFMDLSKTGQDALAGCDIELGKYIAEKLGVELVIETMDFSTLLAAIERGTVDIVIAGMVPKEERKEIMEFSSVFNTDGYQCVVIRASDAEIYKTFADFEGQVVLAQNGTLQQNLVSEQIPLTTMELVTTVGDGVMMVKTGKAAGIAMASVVAELYLKSYPDLAICGEEFDYESLGTVAGIVKGELELLAAVDAIIQEAESAGLYAKWREEALELAASQMVE